MPTVKVTTGAGGTSVEIEANEMDPGSMAKLALETLEQARKVEAGISREVKIGGYQ